MRGDVALPGQFGFELDLSKMTEEEIEEAKRQVAQYKELGEVFHRGELYRLEDPFNSRFAAINFVSEDKTKVVLCRYLMKTITDCPFKFNKLRGLDPDAVYVERESGKEYSGSFLMNVGFHWHCFKEYESSIFVFDKK